MEIPCLKLYICSNIITYVCDMFAQPHCDGERVSLIVLLRRFSPFTITVIKNWWTLRNKLFIFLYQIPLKMSLIFCLLMFDFFRYWDTYLPLHTYTNLTANGKSERTKAITVHLLPTNIRAGFEIHCISSASHVKCRI